MLQDTQLRNTTIIAVVDDDDSIRTALESLLRSSGYTARTYCNALEFLGGNAPAETHCLISDIHMPGMSGIEMHVWLVAKGFHIPTILITGYPEAAPFLGADAPSLITLLSKPCDTDRLLSCIETALR
ncbi:response regulator transcription factor [Pseudomonas akapageensis]|uniref:response regulator transcription factor n=1 Tax=Pseudomonas akapageensis TaxID=2609961 RepID=UPI001408ECF4|nr:response regulator [Pseudomonas akapageensis]